MSIKSTITILAFIVFVGGYFYLSSKPAFDFSGGSNEREGAKATHVNEALAAQFDYLSKNGNSSCQASFRGSLSSMQDGERIRGSCCSPMSIHRYSEQVEGLKKFKASLRPLDELGASKIPDDPYDIEAKLAKELMSYYDMELTPEEQKAYGYAMQNSSEKGPCCCQCWRWYVYGGLGKYLIKNHGFTGEQVTQVWNFSDGCGGDSEHHH